MLDKEFKAYRREYEKWYRSVRVSSAELAQTRLIAKRHHQHDWDIEVGSATVTVHCRSCGMGHGTFQSWVTQPRRVRSQE